MLAIELVGEVLDYLTVPLELSFPSSIEEHKPKHAALSACSLVCKDWSYLAQRLLFRRIVIRSDMEKPFTVSGNDAFLSAIDPHTEKGAWLASCIRILIFTPRKDEGGAVSSRLFSSLLRMPNLRHLDLFTAACTFSDAQLAQLRVEGPKLKSLHAHMERFSTTPETVDPQKNAYRLAACFPSIQSLELESIFRETLRPASPPLNLSLTAFKVTLLWIEEPLEPFIASVVRDPDANYSGLQVLLLTHARRSHGFVEEQESLLQIYGSTLLSLSVDLTASTAASLQQCSRLKRLELTNFPPPALLPFLPRSLEDLSLLSGRTSSYELGVEFPDFAPLMAEIENLPRLQRLTISYCDNEPHFDSLRVLCDKRGIELRTSNTQYVNGDDFLLSVHRDLLELNLA